MRKTPTLIFAALIATSLVSFGGVVVSAADLIFQAEDFDSDTGSMEFQVIADPAVPLFSPGGAFGGQAIETTDEDFGDSPDNSVVYNLTFPEAGTYNLFVRVRVPETASNSGANEDSFFRPNDFGNPGLNVDADWSQVNNLEDPQTNGQYFWVDVTDGEDANGINTNITGGVDGAFYTVTAGSLTQAFELGDREDSTSIDAIIFSTDDLNGSQLEAKLFAARADISDEVLSSTAAQTGDSAAVDGPTGPEPEIATFDFSGMTTLTSIEAITITATLADLDTNAGEADEGDITLLLDGIDTGILLDGFGDSSDAATFTLTIGGEPNNADAILDALLDDGMLVATIGERGGNDEAFGNGVTATSGFNATLSLVGAAAVPEPTSIAIWSLVGLTLAGFGCIRLRRRK